VGGARDEGRRHGAAARRLRATRRG
jgi:hypothetical protein